MKNVSDKNKGLRKSNPSYKKALQNRSDTFSWGWREMTSFSVLSLTALKTTCSKLISTSDESLFFAHASSTACTPRGLLLLPFVVKRTEKMHRSKFNGPKAWFWEKFVWKSLPYFSGKMSSSLSDGKLFTCKHLFLFEWLVIWAKKLMSLTNVSKD